MDLVSVRERPWLIVCLLLPHGKPSIVLMEAVISNDPYNFVEDSILDILFHSDE